MKMPFVHLVQDDDVVRVQAWIRRYLSQQESLGEKQHPGSCRLALLKPDLVPYLVSVLVESLVSHPLGQRDASDPSRLCAGNVLVSLLKQILRHLRGLSAPGVTGHDHDLVVSNLLQDLVPELCDGQVGLTLTELPQFGKLFPLEKVHVERQDVPELVDHVLRERGVIILVLEGDPVEQVLGVGGEEFERDPGAPATTLSPSGALAVPQLFLLKHLIPGEELPEVLVLVRSVLDEILWAEEDLCQFVSEPLKVCLSRLTIGFVSSSLRTGFMIVFIAASAIHLE